MEYESGVRGEGLVAAAARATYVDRLMHLQVDVVVGIGLALKVTLTVGAVGLRIGNGFPGPFLAVK